MYGRFNGDAKVEPSVEAGEERQIGKITPSARFVARVGTSEIILTREVDKAQSFVHDKTRSPWNRRDRWWFLNGADCHVHWSPGMYARGPRWFTRKLGGTRGGGVGASVEKIYATCSRAENDERTRVGNVCSFCYLYEVPTLAVSFVGIHTGVNRIGILRQRSDITLH